jgi:hypothetical protein
VNHVRLQKASAKASSRRQNGRDKRRNLKSDVNIVDRLARPRHDCDQDLHAVLENRSLYVVRYYNMKQIARLSFE